MKRFFIAGAIISLVLLVTSCGTLVGELPSVKNCQHVKYQRDLSKVKQSAECDLSKDGLTGD